MSTVLIIGAGGVGGVVTHKCAQVPEVFSEIILASRTIEKCETIKNQLNKPIRTARVDADEVEQVVALIRNVEPDLVINTALPYQDLTIMEACLRTKTDYLDTANYESPEAAVFCYKQQWAFHEKFKDQGIMALLGCGFDPGVTNVFCAYAQKNHFDEIHYVDIVDCNAGEHGHPFATNFNPEINIREVTGKGKYYENGRWLETEPLSIHRPFDLPAVGTTEMYLLYHEEMESLVKNIPHIKRMRFWMSFSNEYLTHLRVLQNVGMTGIDPVDFEGHKIVPLQFLKRLLPDPSSLAPTYKGRTCIGCMIRGIKDAKPREYFVYNICDHAQCYKEVKAQAVSYTTGVPAMIGALLMLNKTWRGKGVFNVEEFDPNSFMACLNRYGLPWKEQLHLPGNVLA
ncbi:MAG: saccharopine dehydrogenase family protein [Deltaproteobacteria bacterium]|nr:saccharopine dehydrogenase family protein [Deltaproteobacteria bacterium]